MAEQDPVHPGAAPEAAGARPRLRGLSLFLAVVFAAYLAVKFLVPASPSGADHAAVGTPFDQLDLQPLVNGDEPLTLADISGKTILVNYWGPWCPPCRQEMPHLVALNDLLADEPNFRLVSVSCGIGQAYADREELRDATDDYSRRLGISFPIYSDASGTNRQYLLEAAQLSGFGYPTSVLIDADRTIQAVWVGYSLGMENDVTAVVGGVLGR